MTLPQEQPFFGFPSAATTEARVTMIGVPWEDPEARTGSRNAPTALRTLCSNLSTYSPLHDKDLSEIQGRDLGNLPATEIESNSSHHEVYKTILEQGSAPLVVGGDNSANIPLIEVLSQQHDELMVLQLNAHPFGLTSASDTSAFEANLQPQDVLVYGMRSGTREDFAEAQQCRQCGPFPSYDHQRLTALRYHLESVHYRPLLVLCDLSVFDPAFVPGASRPDAGGILYGEFRQMLYHLKGRNVVGASLTGCSPEHDPSEATLYLAAKVLRELTLLVASRPSEPSTNA
ncbi:MAG: hypothetical protein EP343_10805 [Deltaproteobacteria bacterium]|nr:MAG: hypothetical protein EP343_10805 [Deltaproteobacteria bacterium]